MSQDIGKLGEKEYSTTCYFNPLWHIYEFALLLILVPCLLYSPNRDMRAWLILVPAVLVWGALWGVAMSSGFVLELAGVFAPAAQAYALGVCLLLLLLPPLTPGRGRNLFAQSLAVMVAAGLAALFWGGGASAAGTGLPITAFYATGALSLLLAAVLSARRCRRRRLTGYGFAGGLLIWQAAFCILGAEALIGGTMLLAPGQPIFGAMQMLLWGALAGLTVALLLFVVALPFLVLVFRSRFYNIRLRGILGLSETESCEQQ